MSDTPGVIDHRRGQVVALAATSEVIKSAAEVPFSPSAPAGVITSHCGFTRLDFPVVLSGADIPELGLSGLHLDI